MSLCFTCQCGRYYEVGEEVAGRLVRCKECRRTFRAPELTASPPGLHPDLELCDLDDEPPFVPQADKRQASSRRPRSAEASVPRSHAQGDGPRLLPRLLDLVPRDEDVRFPLLGMGSLVMAGVATALGGIFAVLVFVFLGFAALISLLYAGGLALITGFQRGVAVFLPLFVGVAATLVFYGTLATRSVTGLVLLVLLTAGLGVVGGFVAFLSQEKRCALYRRPVAFGVLGSLLMVALLGMSHAARQDLAPFFGSNLDDMAIAAFANPQNGPQAATGPRTRASLTLPEARRGFQTRPVRRQPAGSPILPAPPEVFRTIRYPSPVGPLAAYLTPDPGDGARHPAIIWITGGDSNTIDDCWSEVDPSNDQTASAYRKSGIIMMFPSLRGGNDNPGVREGFYGEVDDILAAADYLASQAYVDPARIYLGGHSTGGTLVLLVAASTDRFRAVFSFGPIADVRRYPPEYVPFDLTNDREVVLRTPALWLHSIRSPTFVFEGTEQGNLDALSELGRRSKNPLVHFQAIQGADHFSVLAPLNQTLAQRILQDDGKVNPFHSSDDGMK